MFHIIAHFISKKPVMLLVPPALIGQLYDPWHISGISARAQYVIVNLLVQQANGGKKLEINKKTTVVM